MSRNQLAMQECTFKPRINYSKYSHLVSPDQSSHHNAHRKHVDKVNSQDGYLSALGNQVSSLNCQDTSSATGTRTNMTSQHKGHHPLQNSSFRTIGADPYQVEINKTKELLRHIEESGNVLKLLQ